MTIQPAVPFGLEHLGTIMEPDPNSPDEAWGVLNTAGIADIRPAMWISYVRLDAVEADIVNLQFWHNPQFLAGAEQPWEALKIGGGAPPVLTAHGWMTIFHGERGRSRRESIISAMCAIARVLVLDRNVLYRSPASILAPDLAEERKGIVDNVVFPTAVDVRDNGRIDVYYGRADAQIGVARMHVPEVLPPVHDVVA